jgi:hypothetical protein
MTSPATTVTALPIEVDLVLYQGDDFYLDLIVSNPDGTDADLSTAIATAEIHTNTATTTPLAVFNATIIGNVIHLHLPSGESTNLTAPGVWDCQIATPDITTLVAGRVTPTAEVTR